MGKAEGAVRLLRVEPVIYPLNSVRLVGKFHYKT